MLHDGGGNDDDGACVVREIKITGTNNVYSSSK